VEVEVEAAGRKLILVRDDGSGMAPEDLKLSVRRHATSKLRSADELWALHSFGFRGEALPSIASVSRFSIASRTRGSAVGYRLDLEAGQALPLREDPLAPGTEVGARDLFFNTPARLKFLKAPATETNRIQQALCSLSLAAPGTAFRLRMDGKLALDFPHARDLSLRLSQVLGLQFLEQSLPIQGESPGISVSGWAARPHLHRANRSGQQLFVNGRAVEHRLLNLVLSQAYGSLIPAGRFASAVLFLRLEPGRVDVNVHPAKREVRFGDEQAVLDLCRRSVAKSLAAASLTVPAGIDLPRSADPEPMAPGTSSPWTGSRPSGVGLPGAQAVFEGTESYQLAASPAPHQQASSFGLPQAAVPARPGWPMPLAQIHRSYLVCQSDEGLVLVDQHAAHERVLYEEALKRLASGRPESQGLLLPQKLSLGQAPSARLRDWIPTLEGFGLEVSDLGAGQFYVLSAPAWLKGVQLPPLLADLLESPLQEPGLDPFSPFRQEVASRLACRAAIKAGEELNLEAMHGLMVRLASCELPWSCPHGRPPMVTVTLAELEKYFQRR
jgi:DNA mismatch repair protein MutL